MAPSMQAFALTICGYRKPGMSESAYHEYLSETHAPLLKDLLVKNKILEYSMTHNTTDTKAMMNTIFGGFPETKMAAEDCFVQIIFRDVEDYVTVKNDPHYQEVVAPDHRNFADPERTVMTIGWVERHIGSGLV